MELVYRNNSKFPTNNQNISLFIERLIQGYSVEKSALLYYLSKMSWKIDGQFSLLFFFRVDQKPIERIIANGFINIIKEFLKDSLIFQYEDDISDLLMGCISGCNFSH